MCRPYRKWSLTRIVKCQRPFSLNASLHERHCQFRLRHLYVTLLVGVSLRLSYTLYSFGADCALT
jgi:hypothetical protein